MTWIAVHGKRTKQVYEGCTRIVVVEFSNIKSTCKQNYHPNNKRESNKLQLHERRLQLVIYSHSPQNNECAKNSPRMTRLLSMHPKKKKDYDCILPSISSIACTEKTKRIFDLPK